MKTFVGATAVVAALLLAGVASAHMGWGPMGRGMMGPGMMGPGMGGWHEEHACPGMGWGAMGRGMGPWGGPGSAAPTSVTEEKAKELAQQYADTYLKGFTVERMLPFARGGMTMYQAELKGPNDETRVLHVNPWGNVMPFGGPWRRAG